MAIQRAQSGVQIQGLKEAQAYFVRMARSTARAHGATITVGSPLRYAYGIETGRHRNGRVARRAGGVFYLTRAVQHVTPSARSRFAAAIKEGEVFAEMIRLGFDIERAAKAGVVRVTGTLQRSIQTIYPGRTLALEQGFGARLSTRLARRPRR